MSVSRKRAGICVVVSLGCSSRRRSVICRSTLLFLSFCTESGRRARNPFSETAESDLLPSLL